MGLSSSRPQTILEDAHQEVGLGAMVHHSPLVVILVHGVNFKTNAYNVVRYGVVESCLAVRGFINFGRVVDVPVGVEHIDYLVDGQLFFMLVEEVLLGGQDEVLYLRFVLLLVFVERENVWPECVLLKGVVLGHKLLLSKRHIILKSKK